ncbi:helix-turn-helix domain-containing protein [Amycolatopsis albispora]|uniref:XRE family transcriptional regulator n=1 Tax=Amycolatopsis albispora TaxID=1804986 RepID=A0A344L384_9PSEU|nr:cupin domain-containing protein [Amycolatopsis albispora]AXB42508.1 XRE family transcriptional regulator [Amycolatopsis albispora]
MDLVALGKRVQALRVERGLSLQALADRSSVSPSMLSSVERGEKASTVVVLDRIANGLGVRLSRLIEDPETQRMVLRRAGEQDIVHEPGGWLRTILTPVIPGVNFEWIAVMLPPGCEPGTYGPWAAGSHEFIAVSEGVLTMTVDGREINLAAGDSLYLAADLPHAYANRTGEICRYHVAALIMRPRGTGTTAVSN